MNNNDFNQLFNNYHGIICMFQSDDKISYVNRTFEELLGYKNQDIIGFDIFDLVNPEDRSEFTNGVFVHSEDVEITVRMYHQNGSHVYLKLHTFQLDSAYLIIGRQMRRNYVGFNYDITKEDMLNQKNTTMTDTDNVTDIVQEHFEALRFVFDNLPIDFWIKDRHHRYIYMNEIMLKHTKIKPGEYFQKNDFELYDRDIANDFVTSDMASIKAKKKTQYAFESKSSRFSKWTEVYKVPVFNTKDDYIGMLACAIDISTTKSREVELEKENKIFMEMIHSECELVIYINHTGDILHAFNTIGMPVEEKNIMDHPVLYSELQPYIEAALNKVESTIKLELNGHALDITVKPILLHESYEKVLIIGRRVKQ